MGLCGSETCEVVSNNGEAIIVTGRIWDTPAASSDPLIAMEIGRETILLTTAQARRLADDMTDLADQLDRTDWIDPVTDRP